MTNASPAPAGMSPPTPHRPPRLHQPWRGVVAVAELVVAAVAVWFAVWCWHRGIVPIVTPVSGQSPAVSSVFVGSWMAGAIGLVLLAGLLLLDAIRQATLALRAGPRNEPDNRAETTEDTAEPGTEL